MWVETRNGLVNTNHVHRITTNGNFVYFFGGETPGSGNAGKNVGLIGDVDCASPEAADELYQQLKRELNASR